MPDGIVLPKVEHPDEVSLLSSVLDELDGESGTGGDRIRILVMVESGWAVMRLGDLVTAAGSRLAGLIFGAADFAADVGLPSADRPHPVADAARTAIVTAAGASGVPALDGMTLRYPVRRDDMLAALELVRRDADRARDIGMAGKWTGHPGQLLATLLAFGEAPSEAAIDAAQTELAAYRSLRATGQAVGAHDGTMMDAATERHARTVLRQAVATGRLDPTVAVTLGVITNEEDDAMARTRRTAGMDR